MAELLWIGRLFFNCGLLYNVKICFSLPDGLVQGTQGISRGGDHSNRQVVVEASGSFSSQETICLSSSHFPTGSCREMEEIGAGHEVKPSWQPYISACNDSTFEPVYVDSSKAGSLVSGGNLPDLCMNGTFAVGKYDTSDVRFIMSDISKLLCNMSALR